MDSQQQSQNQNQQQASEENSGSGNKGSFLCRQSSTRWTPTTDQIRILKDLYYNSGVRSPSAEQIQRISARLRQYGKIEGKNVFYWFQNHKARERQKKRFTSDHNHVPMQQLHHQRTANNPSSNWKQPEDYYSSSSFHSKYNNSSISTPGFSSASSSSTTVGQMGNYGYGSVTMEKSFMDCSISASGGATNPTNYGWAGIDPYSSSSYYKQKLSMNEALEDDEEQEEEEAPEIETLPLFPTQREDINGFCNIKHNSICYSHNLYGYGYGYGFDDGNSTSRTSLELSLNSYTGHGQAPDSV